MLFICSLSVQNVLSSGFEQRSRIRRFAWLIAHFDHRITLIAVIMTSADAQYQHEVKMKNIASRSLPQIQNIQYHIRLNSLEQTITSSLNRTWPTSISRLAHNSKRYPLGWRDITRILYCTICYCYVRQTCDGMTLPIYNIPTQIIRSSLERKNQQWIIL